MDSHSETKILRHRLAATVLVLATFLGSISGCGYHFQGSRNSLYLKEGIQKVYLSPIVNNTYKAGVENLVYNNLIRTLISHGQLTLVRSPAEADAILSGSIDNASYGGSARTAVTNLKPNFPAQSSLPASGFQIVTEYNATLSCTFALNRRVSLPKKSNTVWAAGFSRGKPFPASNQLDVPGTTSALINDTEFDRALSDLARVMTDDVHQSMLAIF